MKSTTLKNISTVGAFNTGPIIRSCHHHNVHPTFLISFAAKFNRIKKVVTILLLLIFATQTFAKGIIILDYGFNIQSYIANCINKTRPQMKCNGKCGMYKKLEKEEKNDTSANNHKAEKAAEQFINTNAVLLIPPVKILQNTVQYFSYNNRYSHQSATHLLRPPIS